MPHEITHYDTLEVSPRASASVIRAAYRCLAQANHPDKNAGAATASERLAHINHAYSVLSDPEKRLRYDLQHGFNTGQPERRGGPATPAQTAPPGAAAPPVSRAFVFRPLS